MFFLARILTLISLCGMPVQLYPIYSNHNVKVGPKSNDHTSSKSIRFPEQFFRNVYNKALSGKPLKSIQYAPLHMKTTTTKKSTTVTTTSTYGKVHNKHLEPKTSETKYAFTKCYNHIPDQHVDGLSSVSRSPGHNAIYRGFPIIVTRDKPFKAHRRAQDVIQKQMPMKKVLKKLNFIKPYDVQQNSDIVSVVSTPIPSHDQDRKIPLVMSNQQYIVNPDIPDKDIDLGPAKPKRPPFAPYNKLHRLHLNIARVYNPVVSQKSLNYSGAYSMNDDSEHAKLQADLPPILHLSKQIQVGKSVNLK